MFKRGIEYNLESPDKVMANGVLFRCLNPGRIELASPSRTLPPSSFPHMGRIRPVSREPLRVYDLKPSLSVSI